MKIIDKIKEFFRRSKTKALPEPQEQYENNKQDNEFHRGIRVTPEETKNVYLENALEQYFQSYNRILDEGRGSANTSYEAVTRINALEGDMGDNRPQENLLLNDLFQNRRYNVQTQMSMSGDIPEYYHIQSPGYQMPDFNNMIRLYINCENRNVAEIARNLLDINQNPNFYLKIDASDSLERGSRSEKIVIYAQDNDIDYSLKLVQYLKSIRPDLFENSEKNNPFMPQIDGIALARQPTRQTFQNLDGTISPISQSANRFISTAISQSYMQVARQVAQVDPNLNFLLSPENINNEWLYARNYPYIKAYYSEYFLNAMESNMKYLSQVNNFQIQGINYNNEVGNEYRDYNQIDNEQHSR